MRSQVAFAMFCLVFSWYGMMAVHEFGHCIGVLTSNGQIEHVSIPLAGFSQTDYHSSTSPL